MPLPNNFVQVDGQNCTCCICLGSIRDGSVMHSFACGHGVDLEENGSSMHVMCQVESVAHQMATTAAQVTCPYCGTGLNPANELTDIETGLNAVANQDVGGHIMDATMIADDEDAQAETIEQMESTVDTDEQEAEEEENAVLIKAIRARLRKR